MKVWLGRSCGSLGGEFKLISLCDSFSCNTSRMLWYDPTSGLIALMDGSVALLVDVSLCLTATSATWAQEYLCQLVVLGHLESCEVGRVSTFASQIFIHESAFVFFCTLCKQEALPTLAAPERKLTPTINRYMVLRAILVIPDNTFNVAEYNKFLEEEI